MKTAPVELLRSIEILSSLSSHELESLFTLMNLEEYKEGETLFNEGDSGEVMYIVLSGSVSISVNLPDGKILEIAEITRGNFFGEMSIFDNSARSATCSLKCDSRVLSLKAADFYQFIENIPEAGIRIMHRMLNITTMRLKKTGAFLSEMVTWGEQARARAITDDFTGLFNRRFLDEAIEDRFSQAKCGKKQLSLVMIDLDHFGTLNNLYGQEMGDRVILAVVSVFKESFRNEDILARYGGDEFTFLLPETDGGRALNICSEAVKRIRNIDLLEDCSGALTRITASMGIASYPGQADSVLKLRERADLALYAAKEAGRDRAELWRDVDNADVTKTRMTSIKKRNDNIKNIIKAIIEKDNFLILGHKNPDEDCISSMIALSLLLNKFSKTAFLMIPEKINENFQYLLNICRYNEIEILHNQDADICSPSAVFIMDTPKPGMREDFPGSDAIFNSKDILKIEIDHHLEADSEFNGDEGYRLVDEASSASELVGLLAFKLKNYVGIGNSIDIQDLFSRNFVLAVLTGIIGDSKMGKYLKTSREKWFYRLFSGMFNEMLSNKTHKNSNNLSSMNEVFSELQQLSKEEDECFNIMMNQKVEISPRIGSVIIKKDIISGMISRYEHDTIITVARYTADYLAEQSRLLSLVVFYDEKDDAKLIQFRIRRSENYKKLDLRSILTHFNIKNGGGHPGAIGFRIPDEEIDDLDNYIQILIRGIEKLMDLENR